MTADGQRLELAAAGTTVSARLLRADAARSGYLLAHGAGTHMDHAGVRATAAALQAQAVTTLRFNFPYSEHGSRRPDRPAVCHATVRAAATEAQRQAPQLAWFAGGRSFGGRMTSQAQATAPLPGVRGLVFLGFPLHPAGKPAIERARHLQDIRVPMLFVQGTRDALAERALLETVLQDLGPRASIEWLEHADHSFHVAKRDGGDDAALLARVAIRIAAWMDEQR
ncbi:MAG TPA: alpha/beta family hydrolase [Steroidobacteraceae bacterium]|nr:alpha/beta family hydrolase [Steroidobacteraceae bacterium]